MIRRPDGRLRWWPSLIAGLLLGGVSAFVSAWGPVYVWSRSTRLEWALIDRETDGGMAELRSFGGESLPRSGRERRLRMDDENPTSGMRHEMVETIDAATSIEQDRYVICCEAMRAGWPWTTMRGSFGTVAYGQLSDPDPLRYELVWTGSVPIAWVLSPFTGFFVSPPGSATVPTFFPFYPTIGFPLHVLVVAAWLVTGVHGFDAWRRDRRLRRGLCPSCSYMLGGVARCPECGRMVPGAAVD